MRKIYIDKITLQKVYENLKNQKEVAKYFGVSIKVIKRLVKEYGFSTYEHTSFIPPREVLYNIFANGGKRRDVCNLYNTCSSQVTKWLQYYGISPIKSDYKHLSKAQKDIVIGSILGDGYLEGRVLCLNHSIKQEDYLRYKAGFFKEDISNFYYRKMKGGHESVRCRTKAFGDIKLLREKFYINKKKIIPMDIQEYLSPLAVAIWFMDDGSRRGKDHGKIATCCFTKDECELLSNSLNNLIGIHTKVFNECGYYTIHIPSRDGSFKKFCEYIRDYVIESMQYKLSEKV